MIVLAKPAEGMKILLLQVLKMFENKKHCETSFVLEISSLQIHNHSGVIV